jgi:hypothetical protein
VSVSKHILCFIETWFIPSRTPPSENKGARVNFNLSHPITDQKATPRCPSTNQITTRDLSANQETTQCHPTNQEEQHGRRRCHSGKAGVGWTPGTPYA